MKKIFSFVLAALLTIILCPTAFAAVDLDSMSNEELLELSVQLQAKLIETGTIKEVVVPVGEYIVGEDIPVGSYTVKSLAKGAYADSYVCVFEKGVKVQFMKDRYSEYIEEGETIGKLKLSDGETLTISTNDTMFTKYAGLGF